MIKKYLSNKKRILMIIGGVVLFLVVMFLPIFPYSIRPMVVTTCSGEELFSSNDIEQGVKPIKQTDCKVLYEIKPCGNDLGYTSLFNKIFRGY